MRWSSLSHSPYRQSRVRAVKRTSRHQSLLVKVYYMKVAGIDDNKAISLTEGYNRLKLSEIAAEGTSNFADVGQI